MLPVTFQLPTTVKILTYYETFRTALVQIGFFGKTNQAPKNGEEKCALETLISKV